MSALFRVMREPGIKMQNNERSTRREGEGTGSTSAEVVDVMGASEQQIRETERKYFVIESSSNVNLSQYTSLHSLLNR